MPPPPLPLPPPPPLTACFSVLPAENFGTVAAGIVTFWLGLRGLTPCRSLRCCVVNFPKPVKLTSPPERSVSVTVSSTASTASPASRLDMFAFCATRSTNSCFVTFAPLLPVVGWAHGARPYQVYAFGSTMRFCGTFCPVQELGGPKERPQTHSGPRERVRSAFLPVDHADGRSDPQAGLAERFDSLHSGTARGDHVLDQADELAFLKEALEPVPRPVVLRLLAHDQERQAGRERGRRDQGNCAQLGTGEPLGLGLELARRLCDASAEGAEQLGPGLEAILVEVVTRAASGAQDEVALEVGVLPQRRPQLAWLHQLRAVASSSRAWPSKRSASAEPSVSETIEPSPK